MKKEIRSALFGYVENNLTWWGLTKGWFTGLIFLFIISGPVFSQTAKEIYHHRVFWTKTEVNQVFDNRFGLGADFVYRRKNAFGEGTMFDKRLRESVRLWAHYQTGENSRLSISPIGFMRTHEYLARPSDLNRMPYSEWRITFQFFHHEKQWKGRIMHTWRYRYELRNQIFGPSDSRFFTRFRFRYRIRVMFNNRNFYDNYVVYGAVSNEIGLNIGKNVVWNTFNQNRLYIGVGFRALNSFRVELRYVDRIRTRGATGFEFDYGRGFMVGLYVDQLSKLGRKDILPVRFWD